MLARFVAMVIVRIVPIRLEFHLADSTSATLLPQSFLVLFYRHSVLVLYVRASFSRPIFRVVAHPPSVMLTTIRVSALFAPISFVERSTFAVVELIQSFFFPAFAAKLCVAID